MVLEKRKTQDISWDAQSTAGEDARFDNATGTVALWYKPPVVEWKSFAEGRLTTIAQHSFDNWDDEGSKAIGRKALTGAFTLLGRLVANLDLPKPNIVPGYSGEIVFLWARKGYELKIAALPDGLYEFSEKTLSDGKLQKFGCVSLNECLAVADLKFYSIS